MTLIHGPRQCGKTTLAQTLDGYAYLTFDDEVQLAAALADPVGFVGNLPHRVILDEVQRAPGLFMSLKAAVDRDRKPGRFVLTGSANVLLAPKLSDSLAGRIEILRLHPLAKCEVESNPGDFIDRLFDCELRRGPCERFGAGLAGHIVSGGYPAAMARRSDRRRREWYRAYTETLVQRDVQELARISRLDVIPRLLELAAGQTARLFNISELTSPFQLSRPTIRDYVTLLERIFLLEQLPPWHSNRLSRLIKTPKLHMGDTGLAASLLGVDAVTLSKDGGLLGQLLETFVYQELRRQASWSEQEIRFYHLRDRDGYEVDMVLERQGRDIVGVEVKSAATVTARDFRAMRRLKSALGDRFCAGVVLYDGERAVRFEEKLFAVPIAALWGRA
ncbi:MAG: ATP-binding protein [Xanthomonadales bacterium]|nr:ATP-binding protein [Xanthomonadales bacterium]